MHLCVHTSIGFGGDWPTHTFKKMHKIMLRVEGIKYSMFSPEIVLHDFFISISN